ncbi:MAG: DnaJ domain-containing protein [Leptolyngbyaceae bacterium]|nr:DnaJ domain-containing protein [Leptolyngbyaceae bacterium]
MPLPIDRGLFKLDFFDHHAILGVAVDAEVKDVRKRYLKIARSLHPDSFPTASESDKQQATEFLSKLVNPAYEKLSQDRERQEYTVVLRLKGQQLARQQGSTEVVSELAKQLANAKDFDEFYKSSIQQLAEKQYQTLSQSLYITGEISELNLMYLIRKYGQAAGSAPSTGKPLSMQNPSASSPTSSSGSTSSSSSTSSSGSASSSSSASSSGSTSSQRVSQADQSYRRAEELVARDNIAKAILELREALQFEPNNARCHALLGKIYMKQNQPTMAKIHINKALQIDPAEPVALQAKQQLDKADATKAGSQSTANSKKPDKPSGGLFGLFGRNKK